MAAIKYKVKLAESERSRLNEVSHRGKPSVRTVKRALALLKADEGLRDGEIAGVLLINAATVARARKRFVEEGLEAAPGRVERYDTEYQRNGTRNLFMFCEPKGGWRHIEVTGRRTAVDFAQQMKWLVDEAYPDATVVRVVLDNLNTHKLGSLYEAFAPSEARRIAKRLELHHTPNHGSWLNMAEIEFSVFSRACLNRRISDEPELRREVAALERERGEAAAIIDWRFSTQDARSKLKHVYPIELN